MKCVANKPINQKRLIVKNKLFSFVLAKRIIVNDLFSRLPIQFQRFMPQYKPKFSKNQVNLR